MSDSETRQKILETVRQMLTEGWKAEDITVRQIAARAGVGIGTISYHYHSKDRLLSDAVSKMMEALAASLVKEEPSADPYRRMKDFLLSISEMSIQYYELSKIHVTYDLMQGDYSICYTIIPLLRDIFGAAKDETAVKLAAIQLITSLQSILLKKEAFLMFSGLNLDSAAQRDQAVDILLQNIIKINKGGNEK